MAAQQKGPLPWVARWFVVIALSAICQAASEAAPLLPGSEIWILDASGDLLMSPLPLNDGSYVPGVSLSVQGSMNFWYTYQFTNVQHVSGPTPDIWELVYEQRGELSLTLPSHFELVETSPGVWETTPLDPDRDGVPGTAFTQGPFADSGQTPNLRLIIAIPEPPSVVLLISAWLLWLSRKVRPAAWGRA